ncbi:MAG: BppU family phage baseplate upper protein [Bacteroidota bacterium]
MAFRIKQNDTSPSLEATLSDANLVAVNLNSATVMLHMKAIGGDVVLDEQMTITDAEGGVIQYDWQFGDTSTIGTYYVEFEVTYSDGSIETFPNTGSLPLVITRELN